MRSYRNIVEIRRKEKLGRRLSLIGLGILLLGLLASFMPSWYPTPPENGSVGVLFYQYGTWIAFLTLPLGFAFASFGSYYINRFARRAWPEVKVLARPDEMLERAMKGFDDKYAYFAFSLPARYVLVGPAGVLVFAVRSDRGRVHVSGDRWREPFSLGRLLTIFAREGVGNPAKEIEEETRKLRELLSASGGASSNETRAGGDFADVPFDGAAVFLNPAVNLTVDAPAIPVLRSGDVKDFVRRKAKETRLSPDLLRRLTDRLVAASTHQTAQGTVTAAQE
jgi:hypothetical protein